MAMAAIGTSFAIYLKTPAAHQITITSSSVKGTADGGYEIANLNGGSPVTPEKNQEITFDIHGYKELNSAYTQPYVLANLKVEIKVTDDLPLKSEENPEGKVTMDDFLNVLSPSLKIEYLSTAFFATDTDATYNSIKNWTADPSSGTITGDVNTYIYMAEAKTSEQKNTFAYGPNDPKEGGVLADHNPVALTIGLDSADLEALDPGDKNADETFVKLLAETKYTVNITLSNPNEGKKAGDDGYFNVAFLDGTMNGWSHQRTDAYEMCMNIEAAALEWYWQGRIEGSAQLKGAMRTGAGENDVHFSAGMNYEVRDGQYIENITWAGGTDQNGIMPAKTGSVQVNSQN